MNSAHFEARLNRLKLWGRGIGYIGIVVAAAAVFTSIGAIPAEGANSPVVADVLAAQRAWFENIRALDVSSTEAYTFGEGQTQHPAGQTLLSEHRFRLKAQMYRSDCSTQSTGTASYIPEVFAYDGNKVQHLAVRSGMLDEGTSLEKMMPYTISIPLLAPFRFATISQSGFTFAALRQGARWSSLGQCAKPVGKGLVQGLDCVWIEFSSSELTQGRPKHFRVAFAEAFAYFPVRVQVLLEDGAKVCEIESTDLRWLRDTGGRQIAVPTRITSQDWLASGRLLQRTEYSIQPERMLLNPAISDDLFGLPPSEAKMVRDMDTGNVFRNEEGI